MNWKLMLQNAKVSIWGAIVFLLGIPGVVSALEDWAAGRSVNWKSVAISVALMASGAAHSQTKANDVHSTLDQVVKSGDEADAAAVKAGNGK